MIRKTTINFTTAFKRPLTGFLSGCKLTWKEKEEEIPKTEIHDLREDESNAMPDAKQFFCGTRRGKEMFFPKYGSSHYEAPYYEDVLKQKDNRK
jgi:hypothetical protein